MRQADKERKKILVPNSVHTWPGEENSEKIEKNKLPLPGIIFSQNRMRQAEKERERFYSQIPFILDPVKKILIKNSKKIQKIKKPLSGIIFSQNGVRQAGKGRKKFQSRIPFILDPRKKIRKKIGKKFKKLKILFPTLFLAQTG